MIPPKVCRFTIEAANEIQSVSQLGGPRLLAGDGGDTGLYDFRLREASSQAQSFQQRVRLIVEAYRENSHGGVPNVLQVIIHASARPFQALEGIPLYRPVLFDAVLRVNLCIRRGE
jgi:hypothetical protein